MVDISSFKGCLESLKQVMMLQQFGTPKGNYSKELNMFALDSEKGVKSPTSKYSNCVAPPFNQYFCIRFQKIVGFRAE